MEAGGGTKNYRMKSYTTYIYMSILYAIHKNRTQVKILKLIRGIFLVIIIAIVVCIRLVSCCCLPKDRAGISYCYESESINVNNWSCGYNVGHVCSVVFFT